MANRQKTGKSGTDGPKRIRIPGKPNARQQAFFDSRARYIAYGGARGGGKSWALRRKLAALCLRYPGLRCLLVRRTLAELKSNHVLPFLREYGQLLTWRAGENALVFPNGSRITLGFCAADRDVLRYQGQEYDIIAIDEATQLSEYQFSIFKACLRGVGDCPRRMYLTCNPGGIGHAWVKRLFVDRCFRRGEDPAEYDFIPALVYDNEVLMRADPGYVRQLESLPPRLRDAWLLGRWDVFEGQFLPEFDPAVHVAKEGDVRAAIARGGRFFAAFDYGFDMLAALLLLADAEGRLWVIDEVCRPGLTLTEAGETVARLCSAGHLSEVFSPGDLPRGGLPRGDFLPGRIEFAVASPDLWNRRQDSGRSGFEIMQECPGMPPMLPADNRRVPGWRVLREYLALPQSEKEGADAPRSGNAGIPQPGNAGTRPADLAHTPAGPRLRIAPGCETLIASLPALLCDKNRPEDASDEPHAMTHAPEALRYALMSPLCRLAQAEAAKVPRRPPAKPAFSFPGARQEVNIHYYD